MAQLAVYLTFNGRCKEALNFYKQCLKGEILLQKTFAGAPDFGCKVTPEWQDKIMHSEFRAGEIFFMASDGMPGVATATPSNCPIALSLNFANETEQLECFNQLAKNGTIIMPLQDTFWGAKFGMLTDQFGIKWMFNCEKDNKS